VLNEIHGQLQTRAINYWRDKSGHEIDFIMRKKGDGLTAIECKFTIPTEDKVSAQIAKNFAAFRKYYSEGENFVVANNVDHSFKRTYGSITITFINTKELIERLKT
jgi:predicted AAA+ superfamily ATPase